MTLEERYWMSGTEQINLSVEKSQGPIPVKTYIFQKFRVYEGMITVFYQNENIYHIKMADALVIDLLKKLPAYPLRRSFAIQNVARTLQLSNISAQYLR